MRHELAVVEKVVKGNGFDLWRGQTGGEVSAEGREAVVPLSQRVASLRKTLHLVPTNPTHKLLETTAKVALVPHGLCAARRHALLKGHPIDDPYDLIAFGLWVQLQLRGPWT